MVQPNLHFRREEYAQRLAQARRLLVERRLDALLLFAPESHYYLRACFENHAGLLANRRTMSRIIASFSRVSLVWTFRS